MKPGQHFFKLFLNFLRKHRLASSNDRVLLAVSAGVDSMVMLRLFSQTEIPYAIAHCNFSLRGRDSDLDMELVKATALDLGVPFFHIIFNTTEYSQQRGISIQEAARELRYDWLVKIAETNHYSLIATAHHLDDSIETMLINLLRGTGIRGLRGIPIKNGNIIRPLLFASRDDVEDFANLEQIDFRVDISNLQDHYLRNRIRHFIIPKLMEMDPEFRENMRSFLARMKDSASLLEMEVNRQKKLCITHEQNGIAILIDPLLNSPSPNLLLYEFLKDYQFTGPVCADLFQSLQGQPGKQFLSKTHKAIKDRNKIFVFPIEKYLPEKEYFIESGDIRLSLTDAFIHFEVMDAGKKVAMPEDEHTALLDYDRLKFPLLLRKTRSGDRIVPLGMKGEKKVSDLLTDKKIPLHQKERTWVLVSGKEIVWVAGVRISENFKLSEKTRKILMVKILPS